MNPFDDTVSIKYKDVHKTTKHIKFYRNITINVSVYCIQVFCSTYRYLITYLILTDIIPWTDNYNIEIQFNTDIDLISSSNFDSIH